MARRENRKVLIMIKQEHNDHCQSIAEQLAAVVNGEFVRCPECGEYTGADSTVCECCARSIDPEDAEPVTIWDELADTFDEQFTVRVNGGTLELCGVRVMVACGGPNIFIDTAAGEVQLFWWSESGSYPLDSDVIDDIENCYREVLNCNGFNVE